MNYRTLGRTGMKVSEIGLGSEAFVDREEQTSLEILNAAIKLGVNCFDLYNPEPYVRDAFGKAMAGAGRNSSSRGTCAPPGWTASTSAPGIWTK